MAKKGVTVAKLKISGPICEDLRKTTLKIPVLILPRFFSVERRIAMVIAQAKPGIRARLAPAHGAQQGLAQSKGASGPLCYR